MNLFVTNISQNVRDEALRLLFAEFGEVVSAKVINDRETGESKGFGFVEMKDDGDALQAIQKLTNADFFGKRLVVSKARPKTTAY